MPPLVTKHEYWLLRHGRSKPNEAGLIVSTKANGIKPEHGLAPTGQEQAKAAGLEWARQLGPGVDPSTLRIVASPFARTLETATLAGAAVGIGPAHASCFCTAEELVERNFGGFELQDHAHYVTVWEEDAKDLDWRPPGGGESVRDVAGRVSALFARLEAEFAGADAAAAASSPRRVLLVAHGDTLSIATAVARGADLGQHRAHAQETGELRRLVV